MYQYVIEVIAVEPADALGPVSAKGSDDGAPHPSPVTPLSPTRSTQVHVHCKRRGAKVLCKQLPFSFQVRSPSSEDSVDVSVVTVESTSGARDGSGVTAQVLSMSKQAVRVGGTHCEVGACWVPLYAAVAANADGTSYLPSDQLVCHVQVAWEVRDADGYCFLLSPCEDFNSFVVDPQPDVPVPPMLTGDAVVSSNSVREDSIVVPSQASEASFSALLPESAARASSVHFSPEALSSSRGAGFLGLDAVSAPPHFSIGSPLVAESSFHHDEQSRDAPIRQADAATVASEASVSIAVPAGSRRSGSLIMRSSMNRGASPLSGRLSPNRSMPSLGSLSEERSGTLQPRERSSFLVHMEPRFASPGDVVEDAATVGGSDGAVAATAGGGGATPATTTLLNADGPVQSEAQLESSYGPSTAAEVSAYVLRHYPNCQLTADEGAPLDATKPGQAAVEPFADAPDDGGEMGSTQNADTAAAVAESDGATTAYSTHPLQYFASSTQNAGIHGWALYRNLYVAPAPELLAAGLYPRMHTDANVSAALHIHSNRRVPASARYAATSALASIQAERQSAVAPSVHMPTEAESPLTDDSVTSPHWLILKEDALMRTHRRSIPTSLK